MRETSPGHQPFPTPIRALSIVSGAICNPAGDRGRKRERRLAGRENAARQNLRARSGGGEAVVAVHLADDFHHAVDGRECAPVCELYMEL